MKQKNIAEKTYLFFEINEISDNVMTVRARTRKQNRSVPDRPRS